MTNNPSHRSDRYKTNRSINLRPWREEKRQQQQKVFTQLSLVSLMFGLLISLVLWQNTTASVTAIQEENQLIKKHLALLDTEIKEVVNLREQRQQLLKRIEVIQKLQSNRPVAVELMQQLANSINDGVFLTQLERTESQLILQGQANTSAAIATWMRSLNVQPRFGEPILRNITTNDKTSLTHFNLLIPLQEPTK
ncbi:MAG: hypothetical protein GX029_12200 [Pseudomonadaceae bacterium]|nr:hypothetical protein [Pseudomonadaceae bacterium]